MRRHGAGQAENSFFIRLQGAENIEIKIEISAQMLQFLLTTALMGIYITHQLPL
jgi:hypothetical protein